MATLHAPQPQTEREYLIEIYQTVLHLTKTVDKLDKRVAHLETWQTRAAAVIGFVAVVTGLVVPWLLGMLR